MLLTWLAGDSMHGGLQRQLVAERPEPANYALGDIGKIGVPAKRLARVNIGQMHLDEGNPGREQGVPQRDARMRIGAGVDQDERYPFVVGSMDAIDQGMLGIALKAD